MVSTFAAVAGMLAIAAWVAWRFGPTLLRLCGIAWWWAGWMCGLAGSLPYMLGLIALGTIAWAGGTAWYAARRGRWPSPLSARLLDPLLRALSR